MDLTVGEQVVEVLVVRPRHEVVVAAGDIRVGVVIDGSRSRSTGSSRDSAARSAPTRRSAEVVGVDVVLVDLGFPGARRGGLDGVADVGPVQPAHDIQAGRFDDVLDRAAASIGKRTAPPPTVRLLTRPAPSQQGTAPRRCRRRADDARSTETPLSIRPARKAPAASGAISSGRPSEWPNPGRSMATTRPTAATRSRCDERPTGSQATAPTATRRRPKLPCCRRTAPATPSQTRKYVVIAKPSPNPFHPPPAPTHDRPARPNPHSAATTPLDRSL